MAYWEFTKLIIAEATLFNDAGKEIAMGSSHFMPARVQFEDVAAYRLDN